jgi:amidase
MPLTGHIICAGQGVTDPLTQVGPMARFVDDLVPLLRLTAGPDGKDPTVVPVPMQHPLSVKLKSLRVAFHTDNGIVPATADVKRTVEAAASAMSEAGADVHESRPKVLASVIDFWNLPYIVDGGQWVKILLKQSGTKRWDPHLDWHWNHPEFTGRQVGELLRTWHRFRAEMLAWMNHFDVLICPVNARASWPSGFNHADESMKAFTYTAAFNMTGWPATVVRCGTSDDGMPIGVQIVSHAWREEICLAVAKHLETVLGGWRKPAI